MARQAIRKYAEHHCRAELPDRVSIAPVALRDKQIISAYEAKVTEGSRHPPNRDTFMAASQTSERSVEVFSATVTSAFAA
jgi:hypothetical protein